MQWKKHVENAKKPSLFVTKKRKNIQKHYITIRYPEKSGHCESPRNKKSENMRTTRLRQKIKKFLDERGEILKVATTKRGGALSGRYEICVWQVRPGALEEKA